MNLFKENMGKIDQIIRIVLGVVVLGNGLIILQNPIALIGLVLLITGVFAKCPIYSITGINTQTISDKLRYK